MNLYKNEQLLQDIKELKILPDTVLEECLSESAEDKVSLDEVLTRKGVIDPNTLGKIISDIISMPFVNLDEQSIDDNVLKILPERVAREQGMIVYAQDDKTLKLVTVSATNDELREFLQIKTGLQIDVSFTLQSLFDKALTRYGKKLDSAFEDIINESIEQSQGSKDPDPPIIRIVDTIIDYAYKNNASDVHIEPLEHEILVRFRIDGMLHNILNLPFELGPQIVTRVKVMANLRTDEHVEPQDGKIIYKTKVETAGSAEDLDIRVSIAAITRGEKIVMRLLSERSRDFTLQDLGLSEQDFKKVELAYTSPNGLILSTGPTGSGKTTTLYAILKLLNMPERNIMTIEDPVEYEIEHVNQIQVNTQADVSFATGLRSIVRQDPDVILVGEIRDDETADIAINSAMTGHLVLSTLHTNDAATTFPRLIDMKIEPYLVASTARVIIAQRLVRKICTQCKVSHEIPVTSFDVSIRKYLGKKKSFLSYEGKGCPVCNQSGYTGRIGIFEIIEMNDEIRQAVTEKKTASEIEKIARSHGMTSMLQDGIQKVSEGLTTLDEVMRVTKDSA